MTAYPHQPGLSQSAEPPPGCQAGDRIALVHTADPYTRLTPGTAGTVTGYDDRPGQVSDRRVPFDSSELVFCVTDMSVTWTGCPGGSADERLGPGGPSPARQRQDRERATWRRCPDPATGWPSPRRVTAPGCHGRAGRAERPTWRVSADNLRAVAGAPDRPVLFSLPPVIARGVPQADGVVGLCRCKWCPPYRASHATALALDPHLASRPKLAA